MNFIKSHWKLLLITLGMIILLFWIGSVTGTNSKLYNMALKQLQEDRTRVEEIRAEHEKWYEETIASLQDKLNLKDRQLKAVDTMLAERDKLIDAKDAEILTLRREREKVITSSDPNIIVDDLHKLGYGTEHRRAK